MGKQVHKYHSSKGTFICTYKSIQQAATDISCDESSIRKQVNSKDVSYVKGYLFSLRRCDNVLEGVDYVELEESPKLKHTANILIVDIETSPTLAYVWGLWKQNVGINQIMEDSFIISYACKWLLEKDVYSSVLTTQEAILQDDSRLLEELWALLNSADVVIAHNACVEKNTPILMQDLTWKKAGDLIVGDKIVGFEEKNKPGETRRDKDGKWMGKGERKILSSEVTNIQIESRSCLEVEFDNGDKVIVTPDHYWLGMSENCRNQQWYRTDKLRIGQRVNKFISPWEPDTSYESGWLSGFISGEGTLKGNGASIDFCQRPTVVLEQAVEYCNKLGIEIAPLKTKIGGLGRGDTMYTYTLGGKWKTLEILGKLRIDRLIEKLNWNKFGGINSNAQKDTTRVIVGIKEVGIHEVAVIETSTGTYIADGYPMHNCGFDIPKINTRFIFHGLMPTKSYQVIDTLEVCRKNFRFTSNKLDYVTQYLGLSGKTEHQGFEMWTKCIQGNVEALEEMERYNRNDVVILENLFMLLQPWIKNGPNMGLYTYNEEVKTCPACGSSDVHEDGYYMTQVSKYPEYRCNSCGHRSRSRFADKRSKQLLTSIGR